MSSSDRELVVRCLSPGYWYVCDLRTARQLNVMGQIGAPYQCKQEADSAHDAACGVHWKKSVEGMDDMGNFRDARAGK